MTRSISETVRFRDLPGFPRLFIDLVEGNPSARQFFPNMPDRDNLLAQAARLQAETWPRTAICDLLREQARRFSSDETAFANIQRLQSTNAVIVLAVLRPRLLGGSLADWSQAMTAARMAGWLGKRGIPAVPVVGIVMDRAQEGLTARVFSREGNKEFSLGGFSGPESTIPGYVGALHEQLAHTLGISAGDSHVLADLASAFSQGSDLTVAFGSFLSRTLASLGLIFFNPPENGSLLVPAGVPENAMGPVRSSQAARLAAAGYLPARSGSNIEESMKLINEIAEKRRILFLDYDTKRITNINTDRSMFSDWVHLNEKGSDAFSKLLKSDLELLLRRRSAEDRGLSVPRRLSSEKKSPVG